MTGKSRRYPNGLPRTIEEVNSLDGRIFEFYVANLLQSQGYYIVKVTPESGDLGTDVVAELGGIRYSVQVKRSSRWVSPDAVREAVKGKQAYGCQEAMVVTNSTFMPETKKLAQALGSKLVDKFILASWIRTHTQRQASREAALTYNETVVTPRSNVPFIAFSVGERVRHPSFGEGQVVKVEHREVGQLVEVEFDTVGTKRLMAKAAKIERVT